MAANTKYISSPTALEQLGVRTAEEARAVRGRAFDVLQRIDAIYQKYGGCLAAVAAEGGDTTAFLTIWLLLLDDLIELRDVLNELTPSAMTAEGIPW